MVTESPILFDAVDRDAYVPRSGVESALLRAARSGRGILVVGEPGSGRTTMLNWLARELRARDEPVARVDAALVADAATLLELVGTAVAATQPEAKRAEAVTRAPYLPDHASEPVRLQAQARQLAAARPTVILLDNLARRDVARTVFGGLRDLLWETRHQWVVTARPADASAFLTPPADTFFAHRVEVARLTKSEIDDFARAAGRDLADGELETLVERAPTPRELIRHLSAAGGRDLQTVTLARGELGDAAAAVLAQTLALDRPLPADDPELTARTGLSVVTQRKTLNRLVAAGFLDRTEDRSGAPGRPRALYLPATGVAE